MEEQLPQTEQPQQVGEIDKLYSVVNQAGLYTKSKDEFLKKYSTPENIDKLHSVVSEAGLYTKPKEDFYKKYYPQIGSVQPTQKQTQQVQTNNPILTQDLSFKNLSKVLPTGGATPSKEASWKNIVQNVAANLELTGTNVASGAANIVRDAAGLIVKQPDLFDKEGKPTKESKNISWYNDPLGKVIVGLNGNKKRMEGVLENNKLPNTFMGELVTSASQLFPDIAAVAALPETKVPEMASAMSKTIATLGNTFTKYLAAKGLTTSYDEARSQGQSMVESSKKGLTGFIKGAETGVEMAALGVGSNVATNAVMKQAEKIGLTGAKGVGAKELVNLMTDVTAYGLVSPATHSAIEGTPLTAHEIANGAGIAAMFRLKGSAEALSKHYELNRALKETQNMRQGVAVANFSDATPESIHEVYKMPESAEELNLKALKFTKEAKETTDLQKKQDLVAKAIMYTKASNVKSVTDNVVNNLNSIDEIANSEELPNSLKEKFIANANSVLELINNSKQQERVQAEEKAPIEQQGVTVIKPEENQPKETIGINVEETKPETQKSGVSVVLPNQNRKPNIIEKQTVEVQQPTKTESPAITEVSEVVKPTKETKNKVKVYHGGGVKSVENLLEGEPLFVTENELQAKEYAKGNEGSVKSFDIDKSKIANEKDARDVIKELGLSSKEEGWNNDELNLHELIDPRFDTSLTEEDIKKVYKELEKRGFEGVEFTDSNLETLKEDINNIVIFDPKKLFEKPKEQQVPIKETKAEAKEQPKVEVEKEEKEQPKKEETKSSEPPKPPVTNVLESTTSIEPPFTLIKRELVKARERVGLGDFEKETVTDEKAIKDAEVAIKEWKEKGTYQKEIDKIIEDANNKKISDLGNNILAQHIADLETAGKKMDRFSKEYDKNRAELKRAIDAGDKIRSEAGRILGRDIQVFGKEPESVQDIEMEMMQDNNTDILTDQQKIEAEKRFNEFKEVSDREAKLRVEAEAEIERLKAELELAKAKKGTSGNTKKTKGDYQAERKTIVESIKDKWKKASEDNTLTAVPLPYAKQLAAIAPDVAKLLNSYISEFGDITLEKARELLKKDIEEAGIKVTDEDVRGLIAGKFKEKKETKSELVTKRQDLVAEEKLLLEIEAYERGEIPKTENEKKAKNVKFTELKNRLAELKKVGLAKDIQEPKTNSERLEEEKEKVNERIAKIKEEILKKERELKEKEKPLNEDLELTRLREVEKEITALRDKYLPKPKDKFEVEKQRNSLKKSLYDSIIKLNEQINNGERIRVEPKNKFENDEYINKLREIKKEKEDLLESIDPRLLNTIKSAEERNIERLEKELDDLRNGIVKKKSDKRELSEIEKDLQEQIFEEKKKLGLIASKGSVPNTNGFDLKITAEERKIARLEKEKKDLEEGIIKQKNTTNLKPTPQQEAAINKLNDEIHELKKGLGLLKSKGKIEENNFGLKEMKKPKTDQEKFETAIKTQIANNRKEQARIQEKINKKDYSEDEPKTKILDNKLLQEKNPDLYNKYQQSVIDKENVKIELERKKIEERNANATKIDKFKNGASILETTLRGTVAGFDQSMAFVQLLGYTWRHPINSANFAKIAIKDLAQKRFFEKRMANLHNSYMYDVLEKSGFVIYEPRSAKSELRNEMFGGDKNLWNKEFKIGDKKYSIGQALERSTVGWINNARLDLAITGVESLYKQGKTFDNNPQEFKALARAVNEWTAHGEPQRHIKAAGELLNPIIWSLKMLSSTVNVLGLGDLARPIELSKQIGRDVFKMNIKESGKTKGFYTNLTPSARRLMAKEVGGALLNMSAFIGAGIAVGAIKSVDMHPNSPTFGYITFNDKDETKMSMLGRFGSLLSGLFRVALGSQYLFDKKQEKQLGEGYGSKTGADVLIGTGIRGKMTPVAGLGYDYFLNSKKNYYTDEKITPKYVAKSLTIPMAVQNAYKEIVSNEPIIKKAAKSLVGVYGINLSDKTNLKEKKENQRLNRIEENKNKKNSKPIILKKP